MRDAGTAFRGVFRNPDLRRLELAAAGALIGQNAYTVALAVYAYQVGGATAVGVVTVIRTVPPALLAPFISIVGDRMSRRRVMIASDVARAVLMGVAAAAALAGWSYWIVFAIAGLARTAGMAFRPAQAALLPKLARTPVELTAANVVASTIESVGMFAGPAVGGLMLAVVSPGWVFAVTGATFVWSALLIARIGPDERPEPAAEAAGEGAWATASAGFRAIGSQPHVRLIVVLYSLQTVIAGAVGVLVVVAAFDLLDLGNAGIGFLNSAAGIGGIVGAVIVLALAARGRLAGDFGVGVALFGLPLVLIAAWPSPATALVALGLLGLGNTMTDVNALTLLQRTVRDDVLARVFGVLESALVGTIGLGAMLAPLVIALIGIRPALLVFGLLLPTVVAALWLQLRKLDLESHAPVRRLELLRAIPIFSPLPPPTLEALAHRLEPVALAAGETLFHAGDRGDRYYIVDAGEAEVVLDGAVRPQRPGDAFGEIALLHDVVRTATVRAITDVRLLALDRGDFLSAVTGHAPAMAAAEAVASARIGAARASAAAT